MMINENVSYIFLVTHKDFMTHCCSQPVFYWCPWQYINIDDVMTCYQAEVGTETRSEQWLRATKFVALPQECENNLTLDTGISGLL